MARATKPAAADAQTASTCKCGCGEPVARQFKQGHDQKLISLMASDIVHGDVWDGTCNGILKGAIRRGDIQEKINVVQDRMAKGISEALAAKFVRAAHRTWELEKNRDAKALAKAERRKAAATKPKRTRKSATTKAAATPSEEAGGEAKPELKLITSAKATNADVDAAEAALEADSKDGIVGFNPGDPIRVKVGKRVRNGVVRGMNQAGKVTAVALTTNGREVVKTEGEFEVVVS